MTEQPRQSETPAIHRFVSLGLPTLLVLGVVAIGWMVVHQISSNSVEPGDVEEVSQAAVANSLTLPAGKIAAAHLTSAAAQPQAVQHVHTVPGRLRYDETRHIDVESPVDGILAEVHVTPGDHVENDQLMAVLRSPEIGQTRSEIVRRQQQREIAKQVFLRQQTLNTNLQRLLTLLDEGASIEAIEAALNDRPMGSYQQEIFSAYARMQLATDLLAQVQPLADSGSVAGRTLRERETERQIAASAFRTARDQAAFAAGQAELEAEADLADADRQLSLAWQSLETLLGYKQGREDLDLSDEDAFSRLEIRAPFAGSVESRDFARNERVERGDSLAVLANTDSLYVEASIRDSDWSVIALERGAKVSVTIPALGGQTFEACVRYFGRQVAAETNSVPLVAMIDNREHLLRPGMFVRVTVPIGEARQALSVKPQSILQHENQEFVFVDINGGQFRRVDVATGIQSDDWVEVTQGLSPGQLVVTDGAFLLKSELLLQGDSE
jgi:cobalt-zinc-cadmium efflux system membrane fusion protein